jgi:3'-phosphoadenosine 5'-phosphosulfate sulfotransferase (PAPS reductase)/FAD synthetase
MSPLQITDLAQDARTLFVCNHSGGKDSQAMYLHLRDLVPARQLVVIHATLGDVEWPGIEEHIVATIRPEHRFFVVSANKTLFEMADHRGMWPSPKNRQCTSDLKRNPIAKQIIAICNGEGFNRVVNCLGLRAEESPGRAKRATFRPVASATNSRREWWEWLPIHELSTKEVFRQIAEAGQQPHWAYDAGMTRLSCCFCIMSSREDLRTAAKLRPELYQRYVAKERALGHTLMMPGKRGPQYLPEIVEGGEEPEPTRQLCIPF